ncbi:hypothetical protein [Nonomuraea sp. NEAU-A123]|uniref:hypothetical protein n=1 Tax=Nonomuraea sp. NEAU-A123 TaxID=2839649 RepID=UPI001BE4D9B0|nr:hypothetical protein [Nonomuraea sp. NEAU-A123]MBT2229649.1 hypothetical protein [Nonomuraea sp. NEAU-A123]
MAATARVALGVRDHYCGCAVLVELTGDLATPRLLRRERIALLGDLTRPDQPHHATAGL